jgi:hypothetical protein
MLMLALVHLYSVQVPAQAALESCVGSVAVLVDSVLVKKQKRHRRACVDVQQNVDGGLMVVDEA